MKPRKKILGASVGSDVHTAGVLNFLRLAENEGYETIFLGGAVEIDELLSALKSEKPDIVALSYRLGAEPLERILEELREKMKGIGKDTEFIFGGTVETSEVARRYKIFEKIFDGSESEEDVVMYLRGRYRYDEKKDFPQFLPDRIKFKKPYPLIRHHIGLPTIEETVEEIEKLANSEILDVVSIAPDQNCQQYFFESEKMDPKQDGAGGVSIRTVEDFKKLYEATRRGNYPLVRCYAGTTHIVVFSKLLKETINNAWAAIPIFWYSELDRRSNRNLLDAIKENMEGIRWNAENGVPVEVNDSHQWALRYAHDSLEVADAYLTAFIAKKLGVRWYVQQYMFNTPPKLSPKMDIAKMIAKSELIDSLVDEKFEHYRMVRAGLLSFSSDPHISMGQLSATMFYAYHMKPDIIHVVAYCEAIRRARAKEIIESVKMVKRAIEMAIRGMPNFSADPDVRRRVEELKEEAMLIIKALKNLGDGSDESLVNPEVLYKAVKLGILDAPGLFGSNVAPGRIRTEIIGGANYVVDEKGKIVRERERLAIYL